jgi:hypothetical protein
MDAVQGFGWVGFSQFAIEPVVELLGVVLPLIRAEARARQPIHLFAERFLYCVSAQAVSDGASMTKGCVFRRDLRSVDGPMGHFNSASPLA